MFVKWRMGLSLPHGALCCGSAILLLICSGCGLLPQEAEKEEVPVVKAPKISQKPEYEVTRGTIELTVSGSGKLISLEEESLYFTEDNMRIKKIYAESGDRVGKGQLIAELDVGDLDSQMRRKELEVARAELEMKEMLRSAGDREDAILQMEKLNFELLQAELAELRSRVAESRLTAPFDGTIVSFTADVGDTVKAYEKIGTIADVSRLTAAASFSSSDLNYIAAGMEAVISINTVGEVRGVVSRLPEVAENSKPDSTDQYLLIEADLPDGLARGTPLTVSVIVERRENALIVPISAIRTQNNRNYVIVSEEDGTRGEVDVEIGIQTVTEAEIVGGLDAGQKVVGK